jgi:hypothetical protein
MIAGPARFPQHEVVSAVTSFGGAVPGLPVKLSPLSSVLCRARAG